MYGILKIQGQSTGEILSCILVESKILDAGYNPIKMSYAYIYIYIIT